MNAKSKLQIRNHLFLTDISLYSLMRKYGEVFSLRLGAFKVVVAASGDSVKEMLVKRSEDYAGRPPFHTYDIMTLVKSTQENIKGLRALARICHRH